MLPDVIELDIPEHKQKPFPFISARELTLNPIRINWLLDGFIERESLNLLFGEPGAGKSLFALDWAFCIAAGIDWHDYSTKQADVVIVAGEGFAGLSRRVKALEQKYNMRAPESLHISKRPAQLMDENNAQWVADTIKAMCSNPGLIIIDTLHRNIEGDENSSQDIAKFISNLDNYLKPLGAAVLVVHHSGHGQKDRSRGSSSIRAAMDGEFSATKGEGGIVLSCHKAKDFEAFKPLQFSLKPVELEWLDDDGEPMTSVYLEYVSEAKPSNKRKKLTARDDAILTALSEASEKHGIGPTAEIKEKFAGFSGLGGDSQKIVHVDHWREQAYKTITVEADESKKLKAKQMAFKRAREKLHDDGYVVVYDDYAWRLFDKQGYKR